MLGIGASTVMLLTTDPIMFHGLSKAGTRGSILLQAIRKDGSLGFLWLLLAIGIKADSVEH